MMRAPSQIPRVLRALGITAVLALAGTTGLHAQRGWRWRPDERTIVGDFSTVQAVAASRDMVFAATENGLVGYDRRFRKWDAPFTPADGYDVDQAVAAALDPADEALWLATRSGLVEYRPRLRQVEMVPIVGGVGDLVFDRDDPLAGVFFPTRFGWRQLGRGQLVPTEVAGPPPVQRRLSAPTLPELLRRFPVVEAMAPTTLLDAQLRPYRFTSGAAGPDGDEAYLGTDGLGLYRLDAFGSRLERMPYGLLAQSVGAVAVDTAVWAGTGAGGGRAGISVTDPDLQRFRYHEAPPGGPRSVRDLLTRDGALWAATDRGVAVLDAAGAWRTVDFSAGLPSDNALVLASAPGGVWVGTDRGLARIGRGDSVTVVPAAIAVLSLLPAGDTLWIGTTQGLLLRAGLDGDLLVPREGGAEPALRSPIVALAALGDTLVAATRERLLVRLPGREWATLPIIPAVLGALRALAADSGGVWVGGERGLGFARLAGKDLSTFRVPDDVPGAVQDLAVRGRYLWVATPQGLVRFDRRALRL